MKLGIVILAAGQGTRMKSALPKVLHKIAGKPMLQHVLDVGMSLAPHRIVIVHGHGGESVKSTIQNEQVEWVEQSQQLGTGHAVLQAIPALKAVDKILVLYGDVPLIKPQILSDLIKLKSNLALLTVKLADPHGYGRILRTEAGEIQAIVEQKDANREQLKINEINSGILCAEAKSMQRWLAQLKNNNVQEEYYLTDIVSFAVAEQQKVQALISEDEKAVSGVNDRSQLAQLEREFQRLQAEQLMENGVTLMDPARFDLRGSLKTGKDCIIDINVIIEGDVVLGDNVKIGANSVLKNTNIGDDVEILENCVFEAATIGPNCRIGPFSRLRPGSQLQGNNHVGNFVELKQSHVQSGSKINHLTYIGDSHIGTGVNVGAGTITCNYDGANKHKTVIGDNAFIGSNSALVAPVVVNAGSTIGAGSVITRDTPEDSLTLSRSRQVSIDNWQRPVKGK